jgi:hypothetical protein
MPMFVMFKVSRPLDVPFRQAKGGAKRVEKEHKREFWMARASTRYRGRQGCYIFAVKTSRAYKAGYVGMASTDFEGETFADGKLQHYNAFLADYKKGRPVLFLIVAPRNKGKPNKSKIAALEKQLIVLAKAENGELRNKVGTKLPRWGIAGVLRSRQGKVGPGAKALRRMIGIRD